MQIIKTVYQLKLEIFIILDLGIFSVYGHGASLKIWRTIEKKSPVV